MLHWGTPREPYPYLQSEKVVSIVASSATKLRVLRRLMKVKGGWKIQQVITQLQFSQLFQDIGRVVA